VWCLFELFWFRTVAGPALVLGLDSACFFLPNCNDAPHHFATLFSVGRSVFFFIVSRPFRLPFFGLKGVFFPGRPPVPLRLQVPAQATAAYFSVPAPALLASERPRVLLLDLVVIFSVFCLSHFSCTKSTVVLPPFFTARGLLESLVIWLSLSQASPRSFFSVPCSSPFCRRI